MTLNHNYDCSNEAVTGIAGNVKALAMLGIRKYKSSNKNK